MNYGSMQQKRTQGEHGAMPPLARVAIRPAFASFVRHPALSNAGRADVLLLC